MGGLAIKPLIGREPDRFTNDEYEKVQALLLSVIGYNNGTALIPMSYTGKTSHGDLDILVAMSNKDKSTFLGGRKYIKNGNVFSVAYDFYDKIFQVDLTFFDTADSEYKRKMKNLWYYMSNGNFGNILGKVLDGYSFQLSGENGLVYQVRKGHFIPCKTYDEAHVVVDQIKLDISFLTMLGWLGLDYDIWKKGFHDNKAASEYIASSPMFDSKFFDISKFKHADRVRINKRNSYEDIQNIQGKTDFTRASLIFNLESYWEPCRYLSRDIKVCIENYMYQHTLSMKYKSLINGEHVSKLTGRTGKELGSLCKLIKDCYPPEPYAFCSDQEEFDELIMYHHNYMTKFPDQYKN